MISPDDTVSVRDSLRRRVEIVRQISTKHNVGPEAAARMLADMFRSRRPDGWDEVDIRCTDLETSFACNWVLSGSPVFVLTESMAALLSMTRSPTIDFDHVPHPAFIIEIPKRYIPLDSNRSVITIAVESYAAMGVQTGAGNVGVIPDSDYTSRWAQVNGSDLNESTSANRWMVISLRIASNVIAYVNEHRVRSECIPRISKETTSPVYEVRPPRDVVVDREFRDSASKLAQSGSLADIRGVLSHYVRGHWRNQPVGPSRQDRRMTWVKPHRRGDVSLGSVVSRVERLR